jgi:hypothetical protein
MYRSSPLSLVATGQSRRRGARTRPWLERLEDRLVLSANWVAEGPAPTTQGEVSGMPLQGNPVTGAINTFALDPNDPNIAFAGAASGGIWRTIDAQSLYPTWTPLTDNMPSLSIGDLAFSPLDPNTLYTGTGSFSNGSYGEGNGVPNGGAPAGVYKTTDLGNTWTRYDTIVDPSSGQTTTFEANGLKIRCILPTGMVGRSGEEIVLAGVVGNNDGGVYQSLDGGQTWQRLSGTTGSQGASGLPSGNVLSIVADPAHPGTFYAAIPGTRSPSPNTDAGIYKSTDGGSTWQALVLPDTTPEPMSMEVQEADNIKLAIHTDPSNDVLYVLIGATTSGVGEESVYRSADAGSTWNQLGDNFGDNFEPLPQINGDGQTGNNLTIAADENLPTRVFVAGTGGILQGDFETLTSDTKWTDAEGKGASGNPPGSTPQNASPHSDSRTMRFDALGNLWESDDGGVYRLVNPDAPSNSDDTNTGRYWVSENGDIQAAEFYSAAWDSQTNTVFAGAQDNGADLQLSEDSATWQMAFFADSTHVAVDNTSLAAQGETLIYAVNSNFKDMRRFTLDSNGNIIDDCLVGLGAEEIQGGCVPISDKDTVSPYHLLGLNYSLGDEDINLTGYVPFVLNAVDPRSLVIGFHGLYESLDSPDISPGDIITDITPDGLNANGTFTALAYGGYNNADVLYAGTSTGQLFLRTNPGTLPALLSAYPGQAQINTITLDPTDWRTAYVVDAANNVWMTTDAGSSWTNIAANLSTLGTKLRTVQVVRPQGAAGPAFVVVGGLGGLLHDGGVFVTEIGNSATPRPVWVPFGQGLPNVQVFSLNYNSTDDVLVAGTFGRGAWTLPNVSQALMSLTPPSPPAPPVPPPPPSSSPTMLPASVQQQLLLNVALLPNFSNAQGQASLTQLFGVAFQLAQQQAPPQAQQLVQQEATLFLDLALSDMKAAIAEANALADNPLYSTTLGYILGLLEGEWILSTITTNK